MSNLFLTNTTEITFLEKIRDNLRRCTAFCFSVSFIKKAGLVLLFKDIEAAIERGCTGKIITSTYQNFTDIESLKSFFALASRCPNFECHLDYESFHDEGYATRGFHSKGYLFDFGDHTEVIIGSSNITRYALLKNIEWDVSVNDPELYKTAIVEFDELWNATHVLNQDIINLYSTKLNFAIERWDMDYDFSVSNIKPNFMQRKALKELNRYRAVGTNRALVVAAAGSGKTYLAAFDALNFNPERLLYIVHEGSILKKSLETFADVFGSAVTYGIFSGEHKEMDADFVFATNLSMCRSLELFAKNEFDYIIIDECHHATAETYKRIIEYFEPEFLLGLTATPERMDNQDVFELFDKNVPYELRLRDAIINELVVPFKYYGIRDQLVDYGLNRNEERRMIAQLASDEHADFIAAQIEAHRGEGKLKALAFCRNVTHARMMCEVMSERYHTGYLTGRNDIGERIRAYNDLQSDTADLEILFTVDILNEGVDIPGVNMVLFLRPTESSTIFIQQLGRGLRKYDNKQYVTVLDFIGNSYKRSVQIAFALGSLSKNFIMEKKLMQALVRDNFEAIGLKDYGVEINVDDLSKEEIIAFIENENFNSLTYLGERLGDGLYILGEGTNKTLRLSADARATIRTDLRNMPGSRNAVRRAWENYLSGKKATVSITFDSEAASQNRDSLFITALHPLAKQAAKHFSDDQTSYLKIKYQSDDLPAGMYPFSVYAWRFTGSNPYSRLVTICENSAIARDLPDILENSPIELSEEISTPLSWDNLELMHAREWKSAKEKYLSDAANTAMFKLESLENTHRNRVRSLEQQISDAYDESIRRIKMSELETIQADFDKRAEHIQADQKRSDIHTALLANGVILVNEV